MPLGVHLPGCPCARCQACALLIERVSRPVDRNAMDNAQDELARDRRNPWDDDERAD